MIQFGEWRLAPYDERNWALEHREVVTDNPRLKDKSRIGKLEWKRTGNYFQTLDGALHFVVERELRERHSKGNYVAALNEAIAEIEGIYAEYAESIKKHGF